MSTTQPEDAAPQFSHEPLPDAGSYIRLISILDYDETRPIAVHCKLTAWPLSGAPSYHAISYAWGAATGPATILVNGTRMQVGQNCEYTLKQATWYDVDFRGCYYWVDAVCIDQGSNEEKGAQVALMGDIYRNADRVLACVGKCNARSRFLYQQGRRDSSLFKDGPDAEYVTDEQNLLGLLGSKPVSTIVRLCQALAGFLRRPYFSRAWVYQELFLGREVSVCCGNENLSIRALRGLAVAATNWNNQRWMKLATTASLRRQLPLISDVDLEDIHNVRLSLLETGAFSRKPTSFMEATCRVAKMVCADPRDRVYGILSTIDWSGRAPIRPDYTKNRLEVATEAVRFVSGEDWATALLYSANLIAHNLDLSIHESPLREAVQARRLGPPGQPVDINQEHRRGLSLFMGRCLAYEDGRWRFEGHEQPRIEGRGCVPMSARHLPGFLDPAKAPGANDYGILLPPVTRPGDWCLVRYKGPYLIARPRPDGHFDIVGKAFCEAIPYAEFGPGFAVHLDAEDVIVLISAWTGLRRLDLSLPLDEEITEYLETRVCGQPGSSYAVKTEPGRRARR